MMFQPPLLFERAHFVLILLQVSTYENHREFYAYTVLCVPFLAAALSSSAHITSNSKTFSRTFTLLIFARATLAQTLSEGIDVSSFVS
jgi:hypothetical protein